ncbi:uncharacterized protein [Haliotis cracherodii]|uniref:uncharacterized protein n=1 Tax=Haliotis cracherodii TaxID=6455 RepID=UPI0039EC8379
MLETRTHVSKNTMEYSVLPSFIYRLKRRRFKSLVLLCFLLSILFLLLPQENEIEVDSDVANLVLFHENLRRQSGQMCVHPQLDPFHPSVVGFFHEVPKIDCGKDEDWVYVVNGTFHISKRARRRYGKITCEYAPIVRGPNDYSARHADHIKPMPDGSPLISDFFKVACVSVHGKRYFNIHSGIAYNKTLHTWAEQTKPVSKTALDLDVLMFGFDSLSRMTWIRKLPQTREYFLKQLNGIELEGYNIVGDGTPQALLPILTGKREEELPEARRGKSGAKPVDNHPWIWKNLKNNGYLTLWAEDMAFIGTFQMRMLGFDHQPTDHSMRTFYLSAERMYARNKKWCLGSVPRHQNFMKWFQDAYMMYGKKRKFMFGFHAETSHDDNNMAQVVDEDTKKFLEYLENHGYLNKTILILMSDHGARFSQVRATAQGKLEERMPYFAFRFPPWFEKQYPEIVRNVRKNVNRLTTPFDVHETFHDILNYTGGGVGNIAQRGISLFKEIPKERTCTQAGIEPHWCACLAWKEVNSSHPVVKKAASAAVDYINSYTESQRVQCAYLRLRTVTRSVKISTNSNVLKFKKSFDYDGRVADLSGKMKTDEDFYQVTFITEPGNGNFEVTLKHSLNSSEIIINEKEISRINRYGSDPACVEEQYPHLRPYCFCNTLLKSTI